VTSAARLRAATTLAAFNQRQDADRVVLRLPVPVSVNDMHAPRKGGGIRRSDTYTAWIDAAGWRLTAQRPGRIAGRYTLDLGLPRERSFDLDACIKAASDLLQLHGVIRNDRDAERIGLWWQDETAEAVVVVAPAAGPISMPRDA
jgi:hypothetical protein